MLNVNVVALNEKGNMKPAVRKAIVDHIASHPEVFADAERLEGKPVFVLEVEDGAGNIVYANFDLAVSVKSAADRAPRKPKAKAEKVEDEIVID